MNFTKVPEQKEPEGKSLARNCLEVFAIWATLIALYYAIVSLVIIPEVNSGVGRFWIAWTMFFVPPAAGLVELGLMAIFGRGMDDDE
jgi:hypothetical protein